MAKATHREVIDGQVYNIGDDLPDYGSIKILENSSVKIIYAEGLSTDVAKLPDWAADGSKCLMTDTSEVYSHTNGEWIKMGG